MSIPLVNRLKRTALVRRTRKAFFLVGECLWSGHGRRGRPLTNYKCLLPPHAPGLCDSKLASLSPRLGNSFRNSRTKGRHSWGHQQRDYCQKFMYSKPEDPHYKSETMQMVWARWRSGDLVIHHITLLSLPLSVSDLVRPGRWAGVSAMLCNWWQGRDTEDRRRNITSTARVRKEQLQFRGRG